MANSESANSFNIRKIRLIYPNFQLKVIAINLIIASSMFALVGFNLFRSYDHLIQMGIDSQFPKDHGYFKFLEFQRDYIISYLIAGGTLAFVVSTVATLALSHRLAGPIVRLRNHLNDFVSGQKDSYENVSFRKRDFFSDLPDVVNGALAKASQNNGTAHESLKKVF